MKVIGKVNHSFICMRIAKISLWVYERVKVCSGLSSYAKQKISEYKHKEKQVEIINKKMPIVASKFQVLKEENLLCNKAVNELVCDMNIIHQLLLNERYEDIKNITNKYLVLKIK